jgi:N-acetylglucosaminyldiphosphoundecaprenol N-acetyl-beta-D-mannosaminyltransferase
VAAAPREGSRVLGAHVDALAWEQCLAAIAVWAARGESRAVFQCNVHSLVTAFRDAGFARVLEAADLADPDGAPVAWCLRRRGFPHQPRIAGPDLMWKCCELAQRHGFPVYLYGSTEQTLARLLARLREAFPRLIVAGGESPPFGPAGAEEDARAAQRIRSSGARIVFVGLGCPKQEAWIASQRGRIPAVMLGVGAAFDFHAGQLRRAPRWMQRCGLEWLYRLMREPRRLWRRYLTTNTLFLLYLARERPPVRG